MKIDKEKCIGCRSCLPYCTVGAISMVSWEGAKKSEIDQEECVECGACLRSEICPQGAISMPDLEWPRIVRAQFGNPYFHHPPAKDAPPPPELKVNDITGRIQTGVTDVVVELGRPGISTSFRDVQKVCAALAAGGVTVDRGSSVAAIMDDVETGKLKNDILGERALNVMIQFRVGNDRLGSALQTLKQVSTEIDTVFSLSVVNRVEPDGSTQAVAVARAGGFPVRAHTKTNLGLGKKSKGEN